MTPEEQQKLQHQLDLEHIFDKHQLLPRVREAFETCQGKDFGAEMDAAKIPRKVGFDALAQIAIHKRATVATMIGCLRHHCNTSQETAALLEKIIAAGFMTYNARDQQLIVVFEIGARLQLELDKFQYPLPMVVTPKELKRNTDSGYMTGRSSVILRDNHTNDDVCLDHLNRVNKIQLSLNLDVAKTIQNKWKGLDKKAPDETWEDFKRRKKAFEKYDSVAKEVIGTLLKEGNQIYLTHKYDKRGRSYCMGFHITYQGTDWNKAIIEFSNHEPLKD